MPNMRESKYTHFLARTKFKEEMNKIAAKGSNLSTLITKETNYGGVRGESKFLKLPDGSQFTIDW